MTTFLRRARWLNLVWLAAIAAVLVNAFVGSWLLASCALTLLALSVYAEALHQALTDAVAERDDLLDRNVNQRLLLAARNPRADWEG
jgi:hypothetical protein